MNILDNLDDSIRLASIRERRLMQRIAHLKKMGEMTQVSEETRSVKASRKH